MARKKRTRRRAATRQRTNRGRPRKLASASLAELQAEIHRRHGDLQQRRDELTNQLAAVDREIASFTGGAARRGRGRPAGTATTAPKRRGRPAAVAAGRRGRRNKVSLVDTLEAVLRGRTMSVTDATEAVKQTGYKSRSANFRAIVNHALLTNPDRFKKVARGQYTAK